MEFFLVINLIIPHATQILVEKALYFNEVYQKTSEKFIK